MLFHVRRTLNGNAALSSYRGAQFAGVSVVLNAKAFTPCRTPAVGSADLAGGGPQHADTLDSYLTGAACLEDLRDQAV